MSENQDHYNRGGLLAFVFSMVFVCAFFIYIVAIHPGVDLKENIRDPEPTGGAALAEVDISKVTNPWVTSADMEARGAKLYKQNCAMCHGDTGAGDGAAGAALNPKPRNLIVGQWTQGNGLIARFKVMTNGIPGTSMAGYGHLPLNDRWALSHYVQALTQNKGDDSATAVEEFAKTVK